MKPTLTIIAPLYNEAENVLALYNRIKKCWEKDLQKFSNYLIFVDDGSNDNTFKIAKELAIKDKSVKVIKFTKNFGHHIAIMAGLDNTNSDYCVLMDSDLQDKPENIKLLLDKISNEKPLIYTIRKQKKGSFFKKTTSSFFWKWINFASGLDIPKDQAMLRLFNKDVLEKLKKYPKIIPFYAGIFANIGVEYDTIFVNQENRNIGESKYNLRKLLKLFAFASFGFGFKFKELLKFSLILLSFFSVFALLYNLYLFIPLLVLLLILSILFYKCVSYQNRKEPFTYEIEEIING